MLGIIIQLAVSWLFIWIFEKGNLSFFGFHPSLERVKDFFLFSVITALCCASGFWLRMYFGNDTWHVNPLFNLTLLLKGLWWNIKSVLFEELIFRGAIFYILIKKIGAIKALLISSVVFGIYHWFSQNAFGNIQQMVVVFFLTGIMGAVYAYGYIKTSSLYVPIAIHLGWNFTQSFIFSQGVIGSGLLIQNKIQTPFTVSYFVYYCILLLPILLAWSINFFMLKTKRDST